MARIVEIRISGTRKKDASVRLEPGPNVIAGDSDTGKSYLLRLVDFVLGAEEMTKEIEEAIGYETAWLELRNPAGETLTLKRQLTGGDVRAHAVAIDNIMRDGAAGDVDTLIWKRQGGSKAPDVTSRLFPFLGLPADVMLRRNRNGETQRLSIRTLLPIFLVDETGIITEGSPVVRPGFGRTAEQRMFSYLLTGRDDSEVVARVPQEIETAEINAKRSLIDDLLEPLTGRLEWRTRSEDEAERESVGATIAALSSVLADNRELRASLQETRRRLDRDRRKAETQIVGMSGLLTRYELLHDRYASDLERLDFISESAHFYDGLQESLCPLCEQPLDGASHDHARDLATMLDTDMIQTSARAEAAKIRGLQIDLKLAITDLKEHRSRWQEARTKVSGELRAIEQRLDTILEPARSRTQLTLDQLVNRRLQLQIAETDREEHARLSAMKVELGSALPEAQSAQEWAPIEPMALTGLCAEIENVLAEWSWKETVRVEFDEKRYDIKVDGKPRRSHGKGFRAVIHAAFSIALLRYCRANGRPHPGFLILDSPLTTVKQSRGEAQGTDTDDEIDPTIEPSFWRSLAKLDHVIQVVVLDNKEPPDSLSGALNTQLFAGPETRSGERVGFIEV